MSLEKINYDDLDYLGLMDLKDKLITEITSIKYDLEDAKSMQAETGEYSDSEWFRNATFALRTKQRQIQKLQWLSKERKKAHYASLKPLSDHFMDVCKEELAEEDFKALKEEAMARRDSA